MKTKRDIYQEVTNSIVSMMETAQANNWQSPWNTGVVIPRIPKKHDGKPYQGINTLLLWDAQQRNAFTSPYWLTYRQAQQWKDAHVRRGEKGETSVFFKPLRITEKDATTGEETDKTIPLIRAYKVFNADQIEGLPERFYAKPSNPYQNADARNRAVDVFIGNTGAIIKHGGNRAFFAPGPNYIQLPEFQYFKSSEHYCATALHELTHWTGAKARLDRLTHARFGDENYAFEELIAELGAAFLCAELGVSPQPMEDHAQYLNSWIQKLKSDKKYIFKAAHKAQQAANMLNSYQDVAVVAA